MYTFLLSLQYVVFPVARERCVYVVECQTWIPRCKTTENRIKIGMSTTCINKFKRNFESHAFSFLVAVRARTHIKCKSMRGRLKPFTRIHTNTTTCIDDSGEIMSQRYQLGSYSFVKWISVQMLCYDSKRINSVHSFLNQSRSEPYVLLLLQLISNYTNNIQIFSWLVIIQWLAYKICKVEHSQVDDLCVFCWIVTITQADFNTRNLNFVLKKKKKKNPLE